MRKPYFAQKRGRGADIAPSGSWELICHLKTEIKAVQEMQNVFFDVYSKFESFESDSERAHDEITTLKDQLKISEMKRQEITAKYSNLRVNIFSPKISVRNLEFLTKISIFDETFDF